ncbi:MAG TPA: NAD-dependent epimerase/dehydratase family protein [Acetobacteraceae bacterium]|jgi:CDP-paratose 2-epimerase
MRVLITGGAGFVGSNLAMLLATDRGYSVTSFDNLRRRGSELALPRLRAAGVRFEHGDIRNPEDLNALPSADLVIECSAEPSVHAGYDDSTRYLVNTNLVGTFNCLEWARNRQTPIIFLSTSRVYSIAALRELPLQLDGRRLAVAPGEAGPGWSTRGIAEGFSTRGARSLYGTTKLASELLIEEYTAAFGLRTIVNRCGVITGPWQMGKVDQGFFVLWAARHLYGGKLAYNGFGGDGRQVRDVLHVADLFDLVCRQIDMLDSLSGQTFNVGGGQDISVSLAELTELCVQQTGNRLEIGCTPATNAVDVPYYVTDNGLVTRATGWTPARSVPTILQEVIDWLGRHQKELAPILG